MEKFYFWLLEYLGVRVAAVHDCPGFSAGLLTGVPCIMTLPSVVSVPAALQRMDCPTPNQDGELQYLCSRLCRTVCQSVHFSFTGLMPVGENLRPSSIVSHTRGWCDLPTASSWSEVLAQLQLRHQGPQPRPVSSRLVSSFS